MVAGIGADFKMLLPCTLFQTKNQVVLVRSDVVGIDGVDEFKLPFFLYRNALGSWASPVAQMVKNLPAMREIQI